MADEFKVDLGQLNSFGQVLKQSVTDLEEARTALSAVGAEQIGTPRLDEACETFQNRWKYGTGQLKDMIKAVDEGVEKTALSYKQFEENLSQALKKMEETNAANTGGSSRWATIRIRASVGTRYPEFPSRSPLSTAR